MSAPASNDRYLLTVHPKKGSVQKRLWDGQQPIALGFPFRWVLERTEDGVRIRSLSGQIGKAYADGVHEIPAAKLSGPMEVQLDGGVVQFHPVRALPAAYSSESPLSAELNVFFCLQNCVVATAKLDTEYKARVHKKKVFTLSRTADGARVTAAVDGLELLSSSSGARKLAKNEGVALTREQITGASIHFGTFYWFVRPVSTPSLSAKFKTVVDAETLWFKKALKVSGAALAALLLITWVIPKPDPAKDELVPEQFTKLVMTKPIQRSAESAAPAAGAASDAKTPEPQADKKVTKAKNAAVVQAFRAKALQNAVSGLLKGGMTNLLQQSELLTGADASRAARRVLDGKAVAGIAAAPVTGLTSARSVEVATMGGGNAGGNGKGVGYGKGERAGVSGQGKSFVSLDLGNATVEEGLTKEEVGRVIHAHMSEIRYCYESSMLANANIEGRVLLDFTIGPAGVVKVAVVKETTTSDPRLDDCVVRRLTKWQFPKPKGGVNVAVSYPFIFKTLGR